MEHNRNSEPKPKAGTMLNQKTNEDFNKKQPDPQDPNEEKKHPSRPAPIIAYDEEHANENKATDATTDDKNKPHKIDGSE